MSDVGSSCGYAASFSPDGAARRNSSSSNAVLKEDVEVTKCDDFAPQNNDENIYNTSRGIKKGETSRAFVDMHHVNVTFKTSS